MTNTTTTNNAGIDYGLGTTNVDRETGIRFGVIHQNDVGERWYEGSEGDYGEPTCGHCGNEAKKTSDIDVEVDDGNQEAIDLDDAEWYDGEKEYYCERCERCFDSDDAYPDEPHGSIFEDEEYTASSDEQGDIFIVRSPYYTRAQYCSPCAPGAVYLTNQVEDGPKGYCFGHEWFEGGKAPYRVWRVSDNEEVMP